jgi:hypothetical protein
VANLGSAQLNARDLPRLGLGLEEPVRREAHRPGHDHRREGGDRRVVLAHDPVVGIAGDADLGPAVDLTYGLGGSGSYPPRAGAIFCLAHGESSHRHALPRPCSLIAISATLPIDLLDPGQRGPSSAKAVRIDQEVSPANEMAGSEFRGHRMNRAIATAALAVSLVAALAACTPSATAVPSVAPIVVPSVAPSVAPSAPASSAAPSVVAPSVAPSTAPSVAPSVAPSPAPSAS